MKRFAILILLCLSVLTGFSGEDKDKKDVATLSGVIINFNDNEPLAGVKIKIVDLNKTVYTDIDGNFSVADFPVGEYSLIIEHPSYSGKTVKGLLIQDVSDVKIRLFPS